METKKTKQTPAKKAYDRKYRKEKMLSISFRLSRVNEQKLIDLYSKIPNKAEWFKKCIMDTEKNK